MKAIVINQYGSPEVLVEQEVSLPEIKDDQVLVEMKATSINPVDWKLREGALKEERSLDFPITLGGDAAGIVKEVGKEVTEFQPGDRVFSRPTASRNGTYAEYASIDANLLAKIPENVSFEEAAAVPLVGQTAWEALVDIAKVKEGDQVLIHGGSGGVGHLAIQIAKHFGAYVATTASEKNEDYVKSLGADQFINYKTEDFTTILSDFDVVLDTQAGETQEKSFSVLKEGGTLVSTLSPPDEDKAAEKNIHAEFFLLNPDGERLKKMADLMAQGTLKPTIGKTLPLTQEGLRKAHEIGENHSTQGKIVIQVNP